MCTLRDVRAISQVSYPYEDQPLVWIQVEFYEVDGAGQQGELTGIQEIDVELDEFVPDHLAPDYYCLTCDHGLHGWPDVVSHVDDFADDDDGGTPETMWRFSFGLL